MEKLIQDLENLGVHIPKNMDDAQLLRYAKQLNPWIVSVSQLEDGTWVARTSTNDKSACGGVTPQHAALYLLYTQLREGAYELRDVGYKLTASQRTQ
jgi:hypothetical protein